MPRTGREAGYYERRKRFSGNFGDQTFALTVGTAFIEWLFQTSDENSGGVDPAASIWLHPMDLMFSISSRGGFVFAPLTAGWLLLRLRGRTAGSPIAAN